MSADAPRVGVATAVGLPVAGLDPAEIAGARAAATSVPPQSSRPAFGSLGGGQFDAAVVANRRRRTPGASARCLVNY